jgi:hypothetical protein
MADFRKLGADRNAVAINKAVGSPGSGPVAIPSVGDVTAGEVVTVTWTVEAPVERTKAVKLSHDRNTVALLAQVALNDRFIVEWSISGRELSATLNNDPSAGDTADFWVF